MQLVNLLPFALAATSLAAPLQQQRREEVNSIEAEKRQAVERPTAGLFNGRPATRPGLSFLGCTSKEAEVDAIQSRSEKSSLKERKHMRTFKFQGLNSSPFFSDEGRMFGFKGFKEAEEEKLSKRSVDNSEMERRLLSILPYIKWLGGKEGQDSDVHFDSDLLA